MPHVNKVIPA